MLGCTSVCNVRFLTLHHWTPISYKISQYERNSFTERQNLCTDYIIYCTTLNNCKYQIESPYSTSQLSSSTSTHQINGTSSPPSPPSPQPPPSPSRAVPRSSFLSTTRTYQAVTPTGTRHNASTARLMTPNRFPR